MAFQIRIAPAALLAGAQRQIKIAEKITQTSGDLSSIAAALGEAWEGAAGTQVLIAIDDICKFVGEIAICSEDLATRIRNVAHMFEAVDEGGTIAIAINRDKFLACVGRPAPRPEISLAVTDNLRIVPEQVRAGAARLRLVSNTYYEALADLDSLVSALAADWEGNAYNRFCEEAALLGSAFKGLAADVEEFADRIVVMATRYEELDNAL